MIEDDAAQSLAELAIRSPSPSFVVDTAADPPLLVAASDAAAALLRCDRGDLEGKPLAALHAIAPGAEARMAALLRGDQGTRVVTFVDPRVGERSFDLEVVPLSRGRVGVVMRETTEERQVRRSLEGAARELQDLYDHSPIAKHSLDHEGVYRRVNGTELRWLGYSRDEIVGVKRFPDLLTPESRATFAETFPRFLETGVLTDVFFEMVRKDGSVLPVLVNATAVRDAEGRFVASRSTMLDITERRRAQASERDAWDQIEHYIARGTEELRQANEDLRAEIVARELAQEALEKSESQLRQAAKMEAVGRLAGGVAHDFNNMLSVIMILTELALSDLPEDDRLRADLEQVHEAGVRAAEITRQLLAFSRQQVLDARPLVVDEVLAQVERLLRRLLGEDVQLLVRLGAPAERVLADAGQLEQVIVNLAVNARDAMPRGGRLTIESGVVELDDDFVASHHGARAGRHVMLAVSDTGVGMSKETLDRAFEPFFTTKETGKGTGLGLATVYGITQQTGGSVWVYSELGRGTTFKVYLPVADTGEGVDGARPVVAAPDGGDETILLVEDDEAVRAAARRILERSGYTVIEAPSPADARAIMRGDQRFDLLLTDVVLPGESGPELADVLHAERGAVPVVYMSGYTDIEVVGRRILEASASFVQKPLTTDALLRAIRSALERS